VAEAPAEAPARALAGAPAAAPPRADESLPPEPVTDQVVVGDIPLEPPDYRPRVSLLAELDRAGAGVTVIQPVAGLQGLGATQLAAAYARAKLAAGWRLVAWVNGADTDSLQSGVAAVADAAGLIDDDSGWDVADAGVAVRQWLETDGDHCLLVLDDVSDLEALTSVVPADGAARVLITSSGTTGTAANLQAGAPVLVDVFTADEALSFLTARTGLDDDQGATAVAAVLGHLPLALSLAAPVIRGQRDGYARYLDRLHTTPSEVSLTGKNGQLYPHAVARAVLLPLAAIGTADKTGLCTRVMAIMSVLSAAGVRRELLHVAGRAGMLAGGGRRVEAALVDQALAWLSDRSLLSFSLDGQTVMMHSVVAQAVRQGLIRQGRLGAVCWVAASVLEAHAIAVAGSPDRQAVRHVPQQVAALDNTAHVAGEVDEELAEILLRLRFIALYHLIELRDSAPQAVAVGEPLTSDLERLLGPDHPDTLNARNSLAAAYLAAGRVVDAIPLLEQNHVVLKRQLGSDHPDTLISQNNLASAYQDAGRVAEAIQLYELNLAAREHLLGVDHQGTLTSRGNLAAAYLAAGRVVEAIPLLEQTLAGRERVLGSDHPDTQTSRKNLAKAYQDAGRPAEATPLLEKALAGRQRVARPGQPATQTPRRSVAAAYGNGDPAATAGLPADQTLAAHESRAPADGGIRAHPARFARPAAELAGKSAPSWMPGRSPRDLERDREMVATITAGDPAGIARAYDTYAAGLYGYCHGRVHDSAAAAESLLDTFVVATATLSELREPSSLGPWLFALARDECRRRIGPHATTRDQESGAGSRQTGAGQPADEEGCPTDATHLLAEATMPLRVISDQLDELYEPAGAAAHFPMVSEPAHETVPLPVVSPLADVTMPFRVVGELADATHSLVDSNGYLGQAELRTVVRSVLSDLKSREREVIELSFRHGLHEGDLAIVLGVSRKRAHALAARAGGQLEKSFAALRTALAGRDACPVVGELLADWDGQLTEQTRDLVMWHMEQCWTCANREGGALRPTELSVLLPLAPLPPELRQQVLTRCSSADETAVAYRRQVVRRAASMWSSRLSPAMRWVSWDGIRTNPGAAIASAAVLVWVVAAVSVTLLTFVGSVTAHAQPPQQTAGTSSSSSATTPASAHSSESPTPTPTPPSSRPATRQPSQVQPPPHSATPSSPPHGSPSPSSSPGPSPSASSSASPSASSSPSPTASEST
jgi:RNA polymerase sigma factor (sigma-70 family)